MSHAFAVDSDARERAASTRARTSDGATGSRPSTSLDAPSPATSRPDTSSAGSSKGWSMSSAIGSMGRRLAQLGQTGDKALNAGPMGASGMAVNKAAGLMDYAGPSLSTMGTHASIAATAAGRMAMEASGAKPTDVAHDERERYRREALLKGENAKALAKSGAGMARTVAASSAGAAADAHGAGGFGSTIANAALKASGAIVSGVGWGFGKLTGIEAAAKNQDNVDALRKYTGEDGGTSRAQEIEERGFHPRPQANGFNDAEAGLPGIDYAKKGESWSEAREEAAEKGHTYAAGGIKGALRGFGAGISGAARGAWSNIKGHSAKAFKDAKKLASSGIASARSTASNVAAKVGSGLSRAGGAMKRGWKSATSWLRKPRATPKVANDDDDEGIELQSMG
ncbi:MAG: hypothetical protein EBY60_09650 [Actinobacteria bacterium]|nr:hypothetical protein [Actinomycetota bacterium]